MPYKNREEILEYQKRYYQKNRERILQRQKKYHDNNKEKRKEYDKQYYEKNKDKILIREKEHRKKDQDKIRKQRHVKCNYGCEQEGKYFLPFGNNKKGAWCCSEYSGCCPEIRRKNSEANKGENHPLYGRCGKDNPSYGQKRPIQSEKMKGKNNPCCGRTGKNHPFYGQKRPEISERMKGENNPMFGVRKYGKNNPAWKDGISKLPYAPDWGPKVKRKVLERDRHECQNCGEIENLAVHHINYNKINCDSTNLITLCVSCNSKANGNRDYWQKLYGVINEI